MQALVLYNVFAGLVPLVCGFPWSGDNPPNLGGASFRALDQTEDVSDEEKAEQCNNFISIVEDNPKPKKFELLACQGNCREDHGNCAEGLFCFQREGFQSIPGCDGGEYDAEPTSYCISLASAVDPAPDVDLKDWTTREGLGESPGIQGIEYLGAGYNIFEGNPRGSSTSQVDPGFRARVIHLEQKQSELTFDQDYMLPLGTEAESVVTCEFSSTSQEISSESQYQSALSKESSQSYSASVSGTGGTKIGPVSASASFAFTKSEKVSEFKEKTINEQSVSFEAKAQCSVSNVKMQPYYDHTATDHFKAGLATLKAPYNYTREMKDAYETFIFAFGTHYTDKVTLGAKHIYTSTIKASEVLELRRQGVDVSSELSVSVQAGWGSLAETADEIKGNDEDGQSQTVNVYYDKPGEGDDPPPPPASGIGASFSTQQSAASSSKKETLESIRTKVIDITEVNVGGDPPIDGNWKTWAASVKGKAMPILYKLTGIWELMPDDIADAFFDAVVDIYGFDLNARSADDEYLQETHFGVSDPYGVLVSAYSSSPVSDYRTIIEPGRLYSLASKKLDNLEEVTVAEEDQSPSAAKFSGRFTTAGKPGSYLCGMRLRVDEGYAEGPDDEGVTGIQVMFCSIYDHSDRIGKTLQSGAYGGWKGWSMCDKDMFVLAAKAKVLYVADAQKQGSADPRGIVSIRIYCSNIDREARGEDLVEKSPYWEADSESEEHTRTLSLSLAPSAGSYVFGVDTQMGLSDADGEDTGLEGLKFQYFSVAKGPEHDIWTYKFLWEATQAYSLPTMGLQIRGNVGEDEYESGDPGVLARDEKGNFVLDVESSALFQLVDTKETSVKSILAATDFKGLKTTSLHNPFTFAVFENVPSDLLIRPGVVKPDLRILNRAFPARNAFRVTGLANPGEYKIWFEPAFGSDDVTFLIYPVWFFGREEDEYPKHRGQVSAMTKSCDRNSCVVQVGSYGHNSARTKSVNLGFSFIAIDEALNANITDGFIHGTFDSSASTTQKGSGYTLTSTYVSSEFSYAYGTDNNKKKTTQVPGGGVKITFDTEFEGIPSVIATPRNPLLPLLHHPEDVDVALGLPHVVVEHVTTKDVLIKALYVNTTTDTDHSFTVLDFDFVVMGPVNPEHKNEEYSSS